MTKSPRTLAVLVLLTLSIAACSNESGDGGDGGTTTPGAGRSTDAGDDKPATTAMKFAACMRDNGVAEFPDPSARGELTIDGIVNGSSLDTSSPAWQEAIDACRDLQPAGFTGEKRSTEEQEGALEFARCMRDNGVEDFPDPSESGPLIDTNRIPSAEGRGALSIPGFQAAMEACRDSAAAAGVRP